MDEIRCKEGAIDGADKTEAKMVLQSACLSSTTVYHQFPSHSQTTLNFYFDNTTPIAVVSFEKKIVLVLSSAYDHGHVCFMGCKITW